MGKTAITSGGAGDVIFSIPVMKSLGVTRVLIKESFYPQSYGSMYSCLKPLLELQGFEVLPTRDDGLGFDLFEPGVKYDFNMDGWRNCRMRGKWHILFSMMTYFRVMRKDWKLPWLAVPDAPQITDGSDYTVWFLSPRWRQSAFNWQEYYGSVPGNKYFIGFLEDWETFTREVGWIEYIYTSDFLNMARMIKGSQALYTNQSVALAIAQGIGHKYHCAFKTGKTNCMMMTSNENHLI